MLITSESSDCFPLLDYLFDKKVTRFLLLLLLLKVIKMEIDVHKVKFCICHFFCLKGPVWHMSGQPRNPVPWKFWKIT